MFGGVLMIPEEGKIDFHISDCPST